MLTKNARGLLLFAAPCTCLSSFADTASVLGLQISWPKTKTQNLGFGPQPDTILVNGNCVDPVSDFTYLGSSQSSDGQCCPDIRRRIGLASAVMSSLDNIWKDKRLSLSIKLRVYLALVQSVLLGYMHPKPGPSQCRQQVTKRIPHEMPAPYLGNILASIRAERRGCRSHCSLFSVGHHLSVQPSLDT